MEGLSKKAQPAWGNTLAEVIPALLYTLAQSEPDPEGALQQVRARCPWAAAHAGAALALMHGAESLKAPSQLPQPAEACLVAWADRLYPG